VAHHRALPLGGAGDADPLKTTRALAPALRACYAGAMRVRAMLALVALAAAPVAARAGTPLSVAAAASLRGAAEELARAFEAARPGARVALSFGASGTFFAQLQNGARFDVFLSADREYPDRLVAGGLAAAADERVYALGTLVVWLPPGSPVDIAGKGLAALASPCVKRIAIANPAVAPFGRAAEAALRRAGVHEAVKDRLVLGTSVGQAAHFASTGAADAALLPRSLTGEGELAHGTVVPLSPALAPPIEQSALVLSGAREPALARAFLAFLAGDRARAILARYGYRLP